MQELWVPLHVKNLANVKAEGGEVDHKAIKTEMDLMRQASQDLGQWSEKRVIEGPDGGPIQMQAMALAEYFTLEELQVARERALVAQGAAGGQSAKQIAAPAE